ncbi:uncharacterized protein LOC126572547 [Anopheles aquasalis]|uniref:uncharacterized protein LOC126572547 n=1 Tax=Anopheles aquasalis TaxID=42839 RepID=UPI00215A1594|nr:uncharacterized protein LOC126572547 [Anopheles aquasalis]
MKQLTVLLALLVLGGTLLLSVVSTAYLPVPYFDQRLSAGPLSKSELAYLRRLAEDSEGLEVTTTIADAAEEAPEGSFTNSCVGEADESSDSAAVSDDEEAPASYDQSSVASDST